MPDLLSDDPNFPAGTPCLVCGAPTARKAALCSRACSGKWGRLNRSPEEEAKRRAKIAAGMKVVRATTPNPMEGMTEPQRLLLEALGVEVDGESHRLIARQEADRSFLDPA